MNENDIYKKAEDALLEEMGEEVLLYHPLTSTTLHLNGPSAIVWDLCDGTRTVKEIVAMIKEAFPEQADRIRADVEDAITEFTRRQVLIES